MANAAVDVGTGATLTFGTTSLAMNWTAINIGEKSIDIIPTEHLGTTGVKTVMGGDLVNQTALVIDFQWDSEAGPNPSTTAEQLTVTFPQHTANTTSAATYIGTGLISKVVYPTLGIEELQMGQLEFTPDGATDFAYTDGV